MKHLEEVIINYDKKLMKANKEIERLGNELQIQIEDNTRLNEYIEAQDKKLQQKENIIKEVREYTEKELKSGRSKDNQWLMGCYDEDKHILEILDKENI